MPSKGADEDVRGARAADKRALEGVLVKRSLGCRSRVVPGSRPDELSWVESRADARRSPCVMHGPRDAQSRRSTCGPFGTVNRVEVLDCKIDESFVIQQLSVSGRLSQNQVSSRKCWFESDRG